jgi:hypothetical protein
MEPWQFWILIAVLFWVGYERKPKMIWNTQLAELREEIANLRISAEGDAEKIVRAIEGLQFDVRRYLDR